MSPLPLPSKDLPYSKPKTIFNMKNAFDSPFLLAIALFIALFDTSGNVEGLNGTALLDGVRSIATDGTAQPSPVLRCYLILAPRLLNGNKSGCALTCSLSYSVEQTGAQGNDKASRVIACTTDWAVKQTGSPRNDVGAASYTSTSSPNAGISTDLNPRSSR